ncbi:hypothetical protein [Methylobacterium sp. R2-1]|uniref:hypothetical protein n=1 Tax=Methylobacterium sp. R2-1 TaxID=2587064 RepID=UPI0016132300|nr:hypothetical protein [Methylobacterium sp. R2-1]MBB2965243.1 putative coiled-coil protein SlyX [Methylobacterium sp. R2-1]
MRRLPCLIILASVFVAGEKASYAQTSTVQADNGSVAFGGTAIGNTVRIEGVPYKEVEEAVRNATRPHEALSVSQQHIIKLLQEKLALNEKQLRTALEVVGEASTPPEQLAAKLVEVAERFKALQEKAKASSNVQISDDPRIGELKDDAKKAIDIGDLAKADEILANVEELQASALDRLALSAAETSGQRGTLALTRLRYSEAAKHFAAAAARVPSGQDAKRLSYLEQEAAALYQQGSERGDNAAARLAIERYGQLLTLKSRERVPLQWAGAQASLGIALQVLGERESGTARLEEAARAFRAALEEQTREREALHWVQTREDLDSTLRALMNRDATELETKNTKPLNRKQPK